MQNELRIENFGGTMLWGMPRTFPLGGKVARRAG